LGNLARRTGSASARAALESLSGLTAQHQNGEGVLRAANVVEDVWEDLKP
jgi:hypothetical protein